MTSNPTLVGITGGIGAGKSIVAKVFSTLGVPVYDADSKAKLLMSNNPDLRDGIINLFGEESYSGDQLNRTHIASQAFHQPALLQKLNELVHPAVEVDFQKWVSENSKHPYVLKEAALLFETGSYKRLDKIILVTASEETRMTRVKSRDSHRSEKDIAAIMKKQLPDNQKEALADFVLSNDGINLLIPRVLELHEQFSSSKN